MKWFCRFPVLGLSYGREDCSVFSRLAWSLGFMLPHPFRQLSHDAALEPCNSCTGNQTLSQCQWGRSLVGTDFSRCLGLFFLSSFVFSSPALSPKHSSAILLPQLKKGEALIILHAFLDQGFGSPTPGDTMWMELMREFAHSRPSCSLTSCGSNHALYGPALDDACAQGFDLFLSVPRRRDPGCLQQEYLNYGCLAWI